MHLPCLGEVGVKPTNLPNEVLRIAPLRANPRGKAHVSIRDKAMHRRQADTADDEIRKKIFNGLTVR
jgi:hypothetical protein